MRLSDVVAFRKDLLLNGAVQVGWVEDDPAQASKAAKHFVFHGPTYHGVSTEDFPDSSRKLVDTASFTHGILKRLTGAESGEPFVLAIAGYGSGKSHLTVTLSCLLSAPRSPTARKVLDNLYRADARIGTQVSSLLRNVEQPFLVVTINGMKDFDLNTEITRQILRRLSRDGLDTGVLENLRSRFKTAMAFAKSLYGTHRQHFEEFFGDASLEAITERLKAQDESAFSAISEIYSRIIGSPIVAAGQESLHDFVRVTRENFCGPGKPYAGLLILFDEFGRYLEFSVQRPQIAGPGALQQLFECVQANKEAVTLVCFVQYELRAYVSRVAPELKDDLNRYVTRYDAAQKARLSINIETLVANLVEKKQPGIIRKQVQSLWGEYARLHGKMKRWFPELEDHGLWNDQERFKTVVCEGCWPLHPLSVWTLYKLSAVGKSLQQRSALSLLAEVYDEVETSDFSHGRAIVPVDLCNDSLLAEFLASERFGQAGATAHAYETVLSKYGPELGNKEVRVLKAVLLTSKLNAKATSKEDHVQAFAVFSGLGLNEIKRCLAVLENELAALKWNEQILRYEIVEDAVPRRAFLEYLQAKIHDIDSQQRERIFIQNYKTWADLDKYPTDFGVQNQIATQDWNYAISLSNVDLLETAVQSAVEAWLSALYPNKPKGQLIYCYVGQKSNVESVRHRARVLLKDFLQRKGVLWKSGAPIAIVFLNDKDGEFGSKLAEYWVLSNALSAEEKAKFHNFIAERMHTLESEMKDTFARLERDRDVLFATEQSVGTGRLTNMLSQAFSLLYPQVVPFDFDGFNTLRGNAAKDVGEFTRALITGRFDREWIAAIRKPLQNRADKVLVDSWGILGDDGLMRIKPTNRNLRKVVELLEEKLAQASKPLNLGEIVETLCAPPYGCNLASAGLILAYFIGSRRDEINLWQEGAPVSMENWLPSAIPKYFFELSVLHKTSMVKLAEETVSEWDRLLEDWELEKTILGAMHFQDRARELEARVAVPQQLFWKYTALSERTASLRQDFEVFYRTLEEETRRIEKGKEHMDLFAISLAGRNLYDLHNSMASSEKWEPGQVKQVAECIADSRAFIQNHFATWLRNQKADSLTRLARLISEMEKMADHLEVLNLLEQKEQLEQHMGITQRTFSEMQRVGRLVADINGFLEGKKISSETSVATCRALLQQIKEFEGRTQTALDLSDVSLGELNVAAERLRQFEQKIHDALVKHNARRQAVYRIDELDSSELIRYRQGEVTALIALFEGDDEAIAGLNKVQKQLHLMEKHFSLLNDRNLSGEELKGLYEKCLAETRSCTFSGEPPPLDVDVIYDRMYTKVRKELEVRALHWMRQNVPAIEGIRRFTAREAQETKIRLAAKPTYLSREQLSLVQQALQACEERLDELEVEGLLARYNALSKEAKRRFVEAVLRELGSQHFSGHSLSDTN